MYSDLTTLNFVLNIPELKLSPKTVRVGSVVQYINLRTVGYKTTSYLRFSFSNVLHYDLQIITTGQ